MRHTHATPSLSPYCYLSVQLGANPSKAWRTRRESKEPFEVEVVEAAFHATGVPKGGAPELCKDMKYGQYGQYCYALPAWWRCASPSSYAAP
eukprot:3650829-Pleurochrysis_carterae.AAC.3